VGIKEGVSENFQRVKGNLKNIERTIQTSPISEEEIATRVSAFLEEIQSRGYDILIKEGNSRAGLPEEMFIRTYDDPTEEGIYQAAEQTGVRDFIKIAEDTYRLI